MNYFLDSHKEIKIFSLTFKDTFDSILASTPQKYSIEQCLQDVDEVLNVLESTTTKGFITSQDLTKFPIVSEILPLFILPSDEASISEYVCGDKSMESYKWIYNLILLTLYLRCIETLHTVDPLELTVKEIVTDLKSKELEIYSRLDNSIRSYIQKRGITIKQNTYIGFDTEFTSKDIETNTLVSSQIAVTTKTYVHIPRSSPYALSVLDENTNKLIPLSKISSVFNYPKLECSIQLCINRIRTLKYEKHDVSMIVLNESLRLIKGLNYYEQPDQTVFSLPRSIIQPYIHFGESFSFNELIQISAGIAKPHHTKTNSVLINLIRDISTNLTLKEGKEKLLEEIAEKYEGYKDFEVLDGLDGFEKTVSLLPDQTVISEELEEKRLTRQIMTDLFPQKVSVTTTKNYYVIAHLTPADLSMLNDFKELKEDLSIVNGSFVTLGQAVRFRGRNIHIRDTMLLAPGGSRSLANIGKLYGDAWSKIVISKEDLENMQGFLKRDREKFIEYALKDAVISLIHASWMEDFNFKIGGVGVPLSLSAIGRRYVKSIWKDESYPGYQISNKYLLGDVATTITPKGLNVVKKIGFVLPYYTANYKGGRNECFMFGVDRDTVWYDYDLVSAYTTVMAMAGHPDYASCRRITLSELKSLSREEVLFSYLIINADFKFPVGTKYPSIPCTVDENCTVYPLRGNCVITGAEYLLAISQKCELKIHDIYLTPFQSFENKPFASVFKQVQEQRREHLKGTLSNLMYKEIGNSIYGSVVRGIGNKLRFDIRSKGTVRMVGDELTNPLIASWTTAFIRSIIGECLHSIQNLGGLVVSVTTDGFITNTDDLENRISDNYLFGEFKKIRFRLSEDNSGLELKNFGKGILAWSTRGQLGIGSQVIATTGFQHRVYGNKAELMKGFLDTLKSENKTIEFIQSRLRSASDIYKKGGHVTMQRRDQLFRMHFDNRRVLEWETTIPSSIECLIDSNPLIDINQGKNLRFIGRLSKSIPYAKYTSAGKSLSKYKNQDEIAVRNFLKGLLSTPPMFNLNREEFYGYQSIIDFVKNYSSTINITDESLAKIKQRVSKKNFKWVTVEKTKESEAFVKYVQSKFNTFDVEAFYAVR